MHYYDFNIGDYKKKTDHLTNDEDLAYRRLLDLYYDSEKPIKNDVKSLARRIRMPEKQEAVEAVLKEFFQLEDGHWRNKSCDERIESYKAMKKAGKDGAAKRWAKGGDSPPIPPPLGGHCHPNSNQKPETRNQEPYLEKDKSFSKNDFLKKRGKNNGRKTSWTEEAERVAAYYEEQAAREKLANGE